MRIEFIDDLRKGLFALAAIFLFVVQKRLEATLIRLIRLIRRVIQPFSNHFRLDHCPCFLARSSSSRSCAA
jgi:hypothetical protein